MTGNSYDGAPRGRRELDRDRDAGQRSEAIGAGPSVDAAASMNLGHDPVPRELFRAQPLEDSQREWLRHVQRAADLFSDEEILALSKDSAAQLVERLVVEPLVLLEDEAYIEDHGSTRAPVLVVPFTGDPDLFELDPRPVRSRSGPGYLPGPLGRVTEDARCLAWPATDFGLHAAMLKRPQSHITQIGLEALERWSQTLYVLTNASKSNLGHLVAGR